MKRLRKVFFSLWPPCEARFARTFIDRELSGSTLERMTKMREEISKTIPGDADLTISDSMAQIVYESESKRREIIESKALAFIVALGISVSIFSALPAFFGEKGNIPPAAALGAVVVSALAIIHLLVAAYYAIETRRITGLAVPSYFEFMGRMKEGAYNEKARIILLISQARFNEPILTKKANSLSVAETMFLRGLVLMVIAGAIVLLSKFLVAWGVLNISSLPDNGCG